MSAYPQKDLQPVPLTPPARRNKPAIQFPRRAETNRPGDGMRVDFRPHLRLSGAEISRRLSLLSVDDFMRVNNATIREGESHRIWPPYVLARFSRAEVIREKTTQHYVLRDANLTRIK